MIQKRSRKIYILAIQIKIYYDNDMPVYVVCILERATFAVKKKGDTVKRVVVTGAT